MLCPRGTDAHLRTVSEARLPPARRRARESGELRWEERSRDRPRRAHAITRVITARGTEVWHEMETHPNPQRAEPRNGTAAHRRGL